MKIEPNTIHLGDCLELMADMIRGIMKPCKKCGLTDRRKNGTCRPCNNAYAREWRQKNKAHIRAYSSRKNAINPQANRDRAKDWNKNNPAAAHNKRCKLNGYEGTFTNSEWRTLCNDNGNQCLKCGDKEGGLTVDHIIPLTRGGTNYIDNIQLLCKSCNLRKHTDIADYRIVQGKTLQPSLFDVLETEPYG